LIGRHCGRNSWPGLIFLLEGGLGCGKTVFSQGLGAGLEVPEIITSPSYPIIQEYQGRFSFVHVDLYRLDSLQDIEMLGLDEYFNNTTVCAIEWPSRNEWHDVSLDMVTVDFQADSGDVRTIQITASTQILEKLNLLNHKGANREHCGL